MKGNWFIYAVMLLEAGACVAYLWERKWVEVLYWTGVIIINAAILLRARPEA